MPYIIVSGPMDPGSLPGRFRQWITFIEFHADKNEPAKCENMEMMMDRLGAERCPHQDTSPFCAYKIDKPPYCVLDRLETEGYKVAGTAHNPVQNVIWTLHKQA